MIITRPIPFTEAIDALNRKGILPTSMSARELEQLDGAITERAFFSARNQRADTLQTAHNLINAVVAPEGLGPGEYMDKARFREIMRDHLESIGYTPERGQEGTIQDLASQRRLDLIHDMNVQSVQGYGQHRQANDPGVLDAFPAQELFRLQSRKEPRDWASRWRAAGGHFYGAGRMIAPKNDPIWTAISRFGHPYPPYDYNSGMWTRPVSRAEAVRLGVLEENRRIMPALKPLNDGIRSSVKPIAPELRDALLNSMEGRGKIIDDVLHLLPAREALRDLVADATSAGTKRPVNFGPLPGRAAGLAADAGFDVADHQMLVEGDAVRNILAGQGDGMPAKGAAPANAADIEALPEIMDGVQSAESVPDRANALSMAAGQYRLLYDLRPDDRRLALVAMWTEQ